MGKPVAVGDWHRERLRIGPTVIPLLVAVGFFPLIGFSSMLTRKFR